MKKDVAEVVGLPTDWDKKNLEKIIVKFEKKYPGLITYTVQQAKKQYLEDVMHPNKAKYGEVNKQAHGRIVLELPVELHSQLEKCLPSLFRSKKHLAWFVKHFKYLLVPEKF